MSLRFRVWRVKLDLKRRTTLTLPFLAVVVIISGVEFLHAREWLDRQGATLRA